MEEDRYSRTIDVIYAILVHNGDIPVSDDETVVNVRKGMIAVDMIECVKKLSVVKPTYKYLTKLIHQNIRTLAEKSDTLSSREKLKLRVEKCVMYGYANSCLRIVRNPHEIRYRDCNMSICTDKV